MNSCFLLAAIPLALALAACADSGSEEGENSGGSGGGGGLTAMPHESCPAGAPVPADPLFARHQGTYAFVPEISPCALDGVDVSTGNEYAVIIQAAPNALVVETNGGLRTFTWDGDRFDLACEGGSTSLVEIGWENGFVRAAFNSDEPSVFVLGFCLGELSRPTLAR